jgi:hypothetical protein
MFFVMEREQKFSSKPPNVNAESAFDEVFLLVRQNKFAMLCEIDCIATPVFFELSARIGKNRN